jgi:plasmid stabilization system protein ParE
VLVRRAAKQIEEADQWWRVNRSSAPDAILEELERAFLLISSEPAAGVQARSKKLGGVRRILLPRVHHSLYYRLAPRRQEIQVLAFWHASRGSKPHL